MGGAAVSHYSPTRESFRMALRVEMLFPATTSPVKGRNGKPAGFPFLQ